jgi:hypothetical protein
MKAFTALITVLFIAALSMPVLSVKAQERLNLTIKPDGSIDPITDLLERNGSTYTFKGDIFGTIWVQTDNIVIDGAGYTLWGDGINTGQNSEIGILLGGPDLSHRECRAVLVKNLRIYNIPRGIFSVGGSNNSFIGNYFNKSAIAIHGNANLTGDLITHNTFINTSISFDYNPNGTDIITENNFNDSAIYIWLAKAPIVDRNYWRDYTTKYPDAKEIGDTGLWNTPYEYSENTVDTHPLITPYETSPPTPSPSPTSEPTLNEELFQTTLIVMSIALTAIIITSLLFYFKKHKH